MTNADKELIELAAKAVGYTIEWDRHDNCSRVLDVGATSYWDPLDDDGDALRLAVKLGLLVDVRGDATWVSDSVTHKHLEPHGRDADAATRRAIVTVAAMLM